METHGISTDISFDSGDQLGFSEFSIRLNFEVQDFIGLISNPLMDFYLPDGLGDFFRG